MGRLWQAMFFAWSCAAAGDINQDLIGAAWKGDASRVKQLLTEGANPNALDGNSQSTMVRAGDPKPKMIGYSALFIASGATKNSTRMVQDLLAAGANINYVQEAARVFDRVLLPRESPDSSLIRLLLEKGADPNGRFTRPGHEPTLTALTRACQKLNVPAAKALLLAGADPKLGSVDPLAAALNPLGYEGHILAYRGEYLMELRKSAGSWSPITRAAWLGLDPIVAMLLEKGALLDDRIISGFTAEQAATERGFKKIVQRLHDALATPGQRIRLRRPALCATTEAAIQQITPLLGKDNRASAVLLSQDGGVTIETGTEVEVLGVTSSGSQFKTMDAPRECWSVREAVQR